MLSKIYDIAMWFLLPDKPKRILTKEQKSKVGAGILVIIILALIIVFILWQQCILPSLTF